MSPQIGWTTSSQAYDVAAGSRRSRVGWTPGRSRCPLALRFSLPVESARLSAWGRLCLAPQVGRSTTSFIRPITTVLHRVRDRPASFDRQSTKPVTGSAGTRGLGPCHARRSWPASSPALRRCPPSWRRNMPFRSFPRRAIGAGSRPISGFDDDGPSTAVTERDRVRPSGSDRRERPRFTTPCCGITAARPSWLRHIAWLPLVRT